MPAPQEVIKLIENFEGNLDAYRGGKYNETQVRRDFIDPLFKARGWDMDNSAGYGEAYRDVIHEDAIKTGTTTKAAVCDFAAAIGIHPGIVVGRLQHDSLIELSWMNDLRESFRLVAAK